MPRNIIITGSASGLGLAIAYALAADPNNHVYGVDKTRPEGAERVFADQYYVELNRPASIKIVCQEILKAIQTVDILINCAGVNEINYLDDLQLEDWERVMNVNARSIYLMTQGLLPGFHINRPSPGQRYSTVLNIVSNASHMPMTASLAYNASKGAAEIMTKQMARELTKRYGITVFGISPNKLAGTAMSRYIEARVPEVRGWTPEQAEQYQQGSLLAGEETSPDTLAEFVAFLLASHQRHKYLTGCIIEYGL